MNCKFTEIVPSGEKREPNVQEFDPAKVEVMYNVLPDRGLHIHLRTEAPVDAEERGLFEQVAEKFAANYINVEFFSEGKLVRRAKGRIDKAFYNEEQGKLLEHLYIKQ